MFCKSCGKQNYENAVLCAHCGVPTGVSIYAGSSTADDVMTGKLIALSLLVPFAGIVIGIKRKKDGLTASGSTCIELSVLVWHMLLTLIGVMTIVSRWR